MLMNSGAEYTTLLIPSKILRARVWRSDSAATSLEEESGDRNLLHAGLPLNIQVARGGRDTPSTTANTVDRTAESARGASALVRSASTRVTINVEGRASVSSVGQAWVGYASDEARCSLLRSKR